MILQFEKYIQDFPCRDLYLFLRKLLEKSNWDSAVGKEMLDIYAKERPIPYMEQISMIYRFAYPEKFWKTANTYYRSRKVWIPAKSVEKLEMVIKQTEEKKQFLDTIFSFHL